MTCKMKYLSGILPKYFIGLLLNTTSNYTAKLERVVAFSTFSSRSRDRRTDRKFTKYNKWDRVPNFGLIADNDDQHENTDVNEVEDPYFEQDYGDVIAESDKLMSRHRRETYAFRRFKANKIIERKYFKPPQEPNLLTWAAKTQIRHLHRLDPAKWTPENLSKSFPISKAGAKKLLKSTFQLSDDKEIYQHDLQVAERWKKLGLEGGPIPVAPSGTSQIASASENPVESKSLLVPTQTLPSDQAAIKGTKKRTCEFSDIVENYENSLHGRANKGKTIATKSRLEKSFGLLKADPRKSMTADEYVKETLERVEANPGLSNDEKKTYRARLSKQDPRLEVVRTSSLPDLGREMSGNFDSFQREEILATDEMEQVYERFREAARNEDNIPSKIAVPKSKRKVIYKYKDGFYDERGHFLYCVPGLKGKT